MNKPVILAISAASGIIYGIRTLEFLLKNGYSTELVISEHAYYIAKQELGIDLEHDREKIRQKILSYINLSDREEFLKVWLNNELWAPPASGSYATSGMIIAPASMSLVASISSGIADNLITRASDVIIKEKKSLVVVPRETPLSSIHLENLLKLSNLGVRIVPPITGFYADIRTLDDSINFVAGKILDAANIENNLYKRWQP